MWPNWKTSPTRWRLLWASIASVLLPWLAGEMIKTFYQPGLHDQPQRSQMLIDFIVAGSILFALTMVLTYRHWLLDHRGDARPAPRRRRLSRRPGHADARRLNPPPP